MIKISTKLRNSIIPPSFSLSYLLHRRIFLDFLDIFHLANLENNYQEVQVRKDKREKSPTHRGEGLFFQEHIKQEDICGFSWHKVDGYRLLEED